MNKIIKISNLKEGDTFIYKGVLYEVWRKQKYGKIKIRH